MGSCWRKLSMCTKFPCKGGELKVRVLPRRGEIKTWWYKSSLAWNKAWNSFFLWSGNKFQPEFLIWFWTCYNYSTSILNYAHQMLRFSIQNPMSMKFAHFKVCSELRFLRWKKSFKGKVIWSITLLYRKMLGGKWHKICILLCGWEKR
jgi:hypothetical protein